MKYKYFCLTLFALAACSQDDMEVKQSTSQATEAVKYIVMQGTDYQLDTQASRSGVIPGQTPEGNPTLKFVWKDGDQVGIFPMASKDQSTIPNEGTQVAFPMEGGTGTNSANFDGGGWAMKSGYSYSAYYPLINKLLDLDKTKIPVSYANQFYKGITTDQEGNPFVDFGKSDFMTAELTTADDEGSISFKYHHVGAVIIMHCQATEIPSKITKFTITGVDPSTDTPVEFILNGHVDLTQSHEIIDPDHDLKASPFIPGSLTSDKTQTLEIQFDENYKPEQNFEVYFTMAPNQNLKGKKLTAEFEYIPASGGESRTDRINYEIAKNIEAGKAYIWEPATSTPTTPNKITVEQAGTLASLIGPNYQGTTLTIAGNINGDDLTFIQSLTNLDSLNLTQSNIMEGGNPVSKSNHISKGQFDNLSKLKSLTLPLSATTIDSDAFTNFTNASNCDLSVGEALARKITVTDEGSMILAGATFKSIHLLDNNGEQKDFYTIEATTHTITTNLPGFITTSAITEAIGTGKGLTLIVKGEINGRDFKSIRESAGCLYTIRQNLSVSDAPLAHLDLRGAIIKASADIYADGKGGTFTTEDNKLGDFVFMYSNLHSINLPEGLKVIGENALYDCDLESLEIPNTVETIQNGAFIDNINLKSIVIPNSVKTIGFSLFLGCKKLASVKLSDQITEITKQIFTDCAALTTIDIPASVKTISDQAFYKSGFTTLFIPATVESVGESFIQNVTTLRRLIFEGASTTLRPGVFERYTDSANCNLEIPEAWKEKVSQDSEGRRIFENVVWKSIKIYRPDDNVGGMGFDGVKDEEVF